jgi:hypothetical protein
MRLQKVASNEHLVLGIVHTLTEVVTFRTSGRINLVTGTPKKGPKMVFAGGRKMLREILGGDDGQGNKGCVLARSSYALMSQTHHPFRTA